MYQYLLKCYKNDDLDMYLVEKKFKVKFKGFMFISTVHGVSVIVQSTPHQAGVGQHVLVSRKKLKKTTLIAISLSIGKICEISLKKSTSQIKTQEEADDTYRKCRSFFI